YYGGILGVTEGMLEEFGPERVMDMPISETGFTGMAVGAALMGLRPVIEMQFTGLITVAMDPLVNTGAKARYVHDGAMSVPMVVRTCHMMHGNAYMSQALETWFTHIPGFKVVTPSTPADAKGLMITAIRDPDPVLYVEHEDLYKNTGPVPNDLSTVPFGKASVRREGSDVTIVAWLAAVQVAESAAEELAANGISAEIIDPRTLVPFDTECVLASVRKTGRLVIVHEAVKRGGFGGEIAAMVAGSDTVSKLKAPIERVANPGVPVPHAKRLNRAVLPDNQDVISAVNRTLGRS
ncbi:MAG: transketolase C-terminal domain-containing protein, partial [SAR202 cluster bacterium]|nr:transketolase C-terminal domain-containing protein [SAR202 cluster bacterium]